MTKKRDRYQSGFEAGIPGIRSAVYDLGMALYCLKKIAKQQELMRARFTFDDGESWTVAQLLEIANDALNQSVSPVAWIYERLQQNEEAARLVVEADIFSDEKWQHLSEALTDTLSNQALVSRGWVSAARTVLARRAKETGGDA